jgi:hypothetical protein
VLVDAGMGPTEPSAGDEDDPCRLFGGQLPVGLRALGVERDEATDVVCTHLHPDHVGWLVDLASRPSFPRATIWLGAGDWRYFIEGRHAPRIQGHVQQGFRSHAGDARLRPIDRDTTVAPGITAVQTPGHTPGHLCVVVSSEGQRALLLGDAITCPVQSDEPTRRSIRPRRESAALANSRVSLGGARRTASRGSPRSHTARPARRAPRPPWPPPRRGHRAEPAARSPPTRRRRQTARGHAG